MIQIVEIEAPTDFESEELRTRAKESTKCLLTRQYKILDDGAETGFASIDRNLAIGSFCIYELWVAASYRGNGIGSAALRELELAAKSETYSAVRLRGTCQRF